MIVLSCASGIGPPERRMGPPLGSTSVGAVEGCTCPRSHRRVQRGDHGIPGGSCVRGSRSAPAVVGRERIAVDRAVVADLLAYVNGDDHPALAQAAIAHAQFETIHPFADRNGRTGRALIHVILRRRGLAPRWVPPISLVLATWASDYIAGLTAYRHITHRRADQPGALCWNQCLVANLRDCGEPVMQRRRGVCRKD